MKRGAAMGRCPSFEGRGKISRSAGAAAAGEEACAGEGEEAEGGGFGDGGGAVFSAEHFRVQGDHFGGLGGAFGDEGLVDQVVVGAVDDAVVVEVAVGV